MRRRSFPSWQEPRRALAWNGKADRSLFYLGRLLKANPHLACPSLAVVLKAVGNSATELVRSLVETIPTKAKRDRILEKIEEEAYDEDDVAEILCKAWLSSSKKVRENAQELIVRFVARRCARLRKTAGDPVIEAVKAVGSMLHLTRAEKALCAFLYTLEDNEDMKDYFFESLRCHKPAHRDILSSVLGIGVQDIEEILQGSLFRLQFLSIGKSGIDMAEELVQILEAPSSRLLEEHFRPVGTEPVPLKAHPISEDVVQHVLSLLATRRNHPVHIFLYGPPGTGKTSFARGVVNVLKTPAYLVGIPHKNQKEGRRFSIATCLTATNTGEGSIIIVDEAEDILNTAIDWLPFDIPQDKGWINQILDTPGVRMIWIANSADAIDESVRRRFTYSIRFRSFGTEQRKRLWRSVLEANGALDLLTEQEVADMARRFPVPVGPMDTAVKGALCTASHSPEAFRKGLTMGITAYLTLANGGEPVAEIPAVDDTFRPEALSLQGDWAPLLTHMQRVDAFLKDHPGKAAAVTALFYGPPGAGKTELGRYLARRLKRELMVVGASDILDMYVGQTEKNIRTIFQKAASQEAVLMIDEIDTLLFSRNRAVHSWEIGMTNEFLARMEQFRGVLIGTTNRLTDLDEAALRRFHHKIGFDFLSSQGKEIMYEKFLAPLAQGALDQKQHQALMRIRDLTPGDFRAVFERHRFSPAPVPHQDLVNALAHESEIKYRHRRKGRAGF